MDKRYFLIIAIIAICCVNLYTISTFSNVVGDASFDVGHYTFTLPNGFSVDNTENNHIIIISQDSKMKIHVYSYLSKSDNYSNAYNVITNNTGCRLLSNGTINYNNITIYSLYYSENGVYSSVFYFNKENNDFKIVILDFNQDRSHNETITIMTELVRSLRPNYKL